MNRENKGTNYGKHTSNYCVVDLETTDVFNAEIIEIAAIKVRNNIIVDEFSTLVNPGCHIPSSATAVNHITDDMVANAPSIDDVIDAFIEFVNGDVIVGFNNASFDNTIIYDQLLTLRNKYFSNPYIDVHHAARRCLSKVENYKLETICRYYHFSTEGEHRALKDCHLTKACYDNLYRDYGDDAFKNRHQYKGGPHNSVETKALQTLHGFLETIISDGQISKYEFDSLRLWIENHRDLQGNYPFDRVFNALDHVLADGFVSTEELEQLQSLFSSYVDPVKSNSCHESITTLDNVHVCLTGEFDYGQKSDVITIIESAGGIIDGSVKKKSTELLVVGAKGSDNWKTGNYGGKIQKAMEFNQKGANIKIIEECDFIPAVLCLIQNQ